MEYTRSVTEYSESQHRLSQNYAVHSNQWSLIAVLDRDIRVVGSSVANSWCFLN
jgi:hypothetical protein